MTRNRGERDLTSQVGTFGAMRARDVSRPDADDFAAAEAAVVVSYRPPRLSRPAPTAGQESVDSGGKSPDAS
jgi:hypothetical protein